LGGFGVEGFKVSGIWSIGGGGFFKIVVFVGFLGLGFENVQDWDIMSTLIFLVGVRDGRGRWFWSLAVCLSFQSFYYLGCEVIVNFDIEEILT